MLLRLEKLGHNSEKFFHWIWQIMILDILNWNLFGLILKQRLKSEDNSKMLDTSGIYFSAKLQN